MEIEKYKQELFKGIDINSIPVKDKWLKLISINAKLYNLNKDAQVNDAEFLLLEFIKDVFIIAEILNLRLTRILDLNRTDAIVRAKSIFVFAENIGEGVTIDLDDCEDSISKALLFIIRELGMSTEEFTNLLDKDSKKDEAQEIPKAKISLW